MPEPIKSTHTPRRAIYPGTFDPITFGHLDLIDRVSRLFDEVVVAVAHNPGKVPLFDYRERVELIEHCINLREHNNIEVTHFDGLLADFVVSRNACTVVRGLRAISDFEFEFQMALVNRKMNEDVETIFVPSKEEFTFISSRIVKEVARLKGRLDNLVPEYVAEALIQKYGKRQEQGSGEFGEAGST
jgi:pantetheine-phosphate adenylyltransferase